MRWIAAVAIAVAMAGTAHAQGDANRYAIVIGSNPGGAGQATLRYAEADAKNFAALLRDIGGYPPRNIELLTRPSPNDVRRALARVAEKIKNDTNAGRQSVLLFFYSGHARARSLNLGDDEMALDGLRRALLELPSTLTLVILDACQSGAFSNVKGAEPAADFSSNSVDRLGATGVAVMASSSATELSQESTRLGSSYFTHYLIVGMRGAGDNNGDGVVSIDEAYRYAYNRTLIATARTAVGRQHVTLETDLRGKGEIALAYPARADARLELPADLAGELLIHHEKSNAVIAEVSKVKGAAVVLAMPAGSYAAVVTRNGEARKCWFRLRRGQTATIDIGRCDRIEIEQAATKGDLGPDMAIELGVGIGLWRDDRYTSRLGDFGYIDESGDTYLTGGFVYSLGPQVAVVGRVSLLGGGSYLRTDDTADLEFRWSTYAVSAMARATLPLLSGRLRAFAEAGGGGTLASTDLEGAQDISEREYHWGYVLEAGGGLHWMPFLYGDADSMTDMFGFTARAGWAYAPTIDNLAGDTHDSGGAMFCFGMRAEF